MSKEATHTWLTSRNIITVLAIVFLLWFIWNFYIIISYFLIAAVISLLGRPIVEVFDHIKIGKFAVPRWLSALIVIMIFASVLVGLFSLFVPMIITQAEVMTSINTEKVAERLEGPLHQIENLIIEFQSGDTAQVSSKSFLTQQLNQWISITSITGILNNILGEMGDIIVGVFSVVFISFFFLRDQRLFYNIIMSLSPTQFESQTRRILHSSKITLTRYFAGLILQSTVVFILISTGLAIMSFEYALLIGFFCALVNIIPYLGPIIGTLFALLITITTTLSVNPDANIATIILKIVLLCQGVQMLDNYVSQPIIFSKRINAHPLEIFFIVLVFGTLAGIPGMILAVPVYSFIRIIAREFFSEFKVVKKITANIE